MANPDSTISAEQSGDPSSRRLTDSVPDCVIVIDETGCVQYFSPEAEALFGYPEAEIVNRHFGTLFPSADRGVDPGLGGYFAMGGAAMVATERVVTGRRRNGGSFPMGLTIREVRLQGEKLFTAAIRDLSALSAPEAHRLDPREELEKVPPTTEVDHLATALVTVLIRPLSTVLHDLNSGPGTRSDGDKEQARQVTSLLVGVAERAALMILHLRATLGQRDAEMRVESVPETIAMARDIALSRIPQPATVIVQIAENATTAVIDKKQIQQVLLNLIRNAIEAMASSPRREVTISAARGGDMVEIQVADTGPGVPFEIRPRLFQPFATTRPGRMGVGLSLCRTIVEAHGGAIRAEDCDGGGAVFRFTVPCPAARAA